ncbi:carbonic anhydrase [Auricularia subglabra TFB-10046 SS5]|nr:carbonic anhydrase [Auricularia subglabra TFB-10046 SS5]
MLSRPAVLVLAASGALACLYERPLVYRRDGAAVSTFGYTGESGPLGWAHLAPANGACFNGTHQSPIVIDTRSTPKLPAAPPLTIPDVAEGGALLENLGATLEVVVNGTLKLDNTDYAMAQFHFHTPSEHRIDEEYYPLEMHMVFKSTTGGVAVIGVPFEISDDNKSTALLDSVFHHLDNATVAGSEAHTGELKFAEVIGAVQNGPLYSYSGSLTTPPCTQGVSWMVLGTPLAIDVKTYKAVKKVMKFNARFTQNTPGEVNLAEYSAENQSESNPPNAASASSVYSLAMTLMSIASLAWISL